MQIRVLIAEHPRLTARFLALIDESGLCRSDRRGGKATVVDRQGNKILYGSRGYTEENIFGQEADLIVTFKISTRDGFAQEVALMPGLIRHRTETDLCYLFVPLGLDKDAIQAIDEFLHMIRLRRIRPSDWSGRSTSEPSPSDDRGYHH